MKLGDVREKTVQEFLISDKLELRQLIADVYQHYGRMPKVIMVGPHVKRWQGPVKFLDVPLEWSDVLENGEVFALLEKSTRIDLAKAALTKRPLVFRQKLVEP